MLELIKELFGEAVTEEKLLRLTEALEQGYVSKAEVSALEANHGEELETVKGELADVRLAAEAALEKARSEAEAERFTIILWHALEKAGAKNVKAVQALLNMEGLQLENGEIIGLAEQIALIRQENGFLFKEPELEVQFMRPAGQGKAHVTAEDFKKMGYMERLKLKKEQPELYRKFLQK